MKTLKTSEKIYGPSGTEQTNKVREDPAVNNGLETSQGSEVTLAVGAPPMYHVEQNMLIVPKDNFCRKMARPGGRVAKSTTLAHLVMICETVR